MESLQTAFFSLAFMTGSLVLAIAALAGVAWAGWRLWQWLAFFRNWRLRVKTLSQRFWYHVAYGTVFVVDTTDTLVWFVNVGDVGDMDPATAARKLAAIEGKPTPDDRDFSAVQCMRLTSFWHPHKQTPFMISGAECVEIMQKLKDQVDGRVE